MGYDGRMGKRRNNKAAGARGGYGSLREKLRVDEKARSGGTSGTGGAGAPADQAFSAANFFMKSIRCSTPSTGIAL